MYQEKLRQNREDNYDLKELRTSENQLYFFILLLFLLIFTTTIRHNFEEKNTCFSTQGMPRFAYFEGSFSKFRGGVPPDPPKKARALRALAKHLAALDLKFSAIFSLGSWKHWLMIN